VALGSNCIQYVELRVRTAAKDLHSSWGGGPECRVAPDVGAGQVEGRAHGPRADSGLLRSRANAQRADDALAEREPFDLAQYRALFGITDFLYDWDGREARRHYLFDATGTICGLDNGDDKRDGRPAR
jgi:hypothetical protein